MRRLLDPLIWRSAAFNVAFYASLLGWLLIALPTAVMPRRAVIAIAKAWGRYNIWLLGVICGTRVEWRGRDKIPTGPLLVAAKHQSFWETFALMAQFEDATFILKRELMWIPLFGWLMAKARMIPIDRAAGKDALDPLMAALRKALADGQQVIIFPEGTRRPPGAAPDYKLGIVFLYAEGNVPCLPVALNSGLFWGRRGFLRRPGTIVVEFLDPIPAGVHRRVFFKRVQHDIETATAKLVGEGLQKRELEVQGAELMEGGGTGPAARRRPGPAPRS